MQAQNSVGKHHRMRADLSQGYYPMAILSPVVCVVLNSAWRIANGLEWG